MGISIELHSRDTNKLNSVINQLAVETGQTLREVLPSEMRLLASDLAFNTYPRGKGSGDNKAHKEKIKSRIRDVYPNVGYVVNLLKKENEGAAGNFAGLIERRQFSKAQSILNGFLPQMNIRIGGFDGGSLHKSQNGQKRITSRLMSPGYTRVNSYINRTANKSGYAKGGFATAARQLGGVRGIPGWATRQKAPGTGTITGDGESLTVTLTNNVNHLHYALKPHNEATAVNFRSKQVGARLRLIQTRKINKAMKNFK